MSFFLFFGGRPRFRFGLGGVTARDCTVEVVAGLLSDSSSSSLSSSSSSKSVSGFDLLTMISSSDSESSSCVLKDAPGNFVFAAARFAARLVDGEDDGRKVVLSEIVELVCTGAAGGDTICRCCLACMAAITAGFPPVLEAIDCTAEGDGPVNP